MICQRLTILQSCVHLCKDKSAIKFQWEIPVLLMMDSLMIVLLHELIINLITMH